MSTKTKKGSRVEELVKEALGEAVEETVQETVAELRGNGKSRLQNVVDLPKLDFRTVEVNIEGISPLIVHAWSAKAVKMMLDKQTGEASKGRAKKDPLEDFRGSLYPVEVDGKQRWGIPSPSFKAAAVSAANSVELKMTQMRQAFHVNSYTTPIDAPPLPKSIYTDWDRQYEKELTNEHAAGLSMRQDLVRLESGVADVRFRGFWPVWGARLTVEYNASMITLQQLLMLFEASGYGCGLGEWRPSAPVCRSGEFGRFRISRK